MGNISLAIICVLDYTIIHLSCPQIDSSPQDYVDAHNAARSQVGVGNITWDASIAAYAQNYANQRMGDCSKLVYSGGPYGENLAWSSGDLSGTAAVNLWVGEKAYYNYTTNSCTNGRQCSHYTQVVWQESLRLGCGKVRCNDGGTFINCNYDPPGNYVGQWPYVQDNSSVHESSGQDSPQDYVDAHNAARSQVGVGPLTWDATVEAYAQNYANQRKGDCSLVHSGGRYGENLAWSSGDLLGTAAVNLWVEEKADYNYNSNSCAAGRQCGHYTQVVWRNSVHLGCAKVRCNNGGTFITCNYDPPGNYVGQRPY